MNIKKAIRDGLSIVFENFKMIPVVYIANTSLALLLALPVFSLLNNDIGYKGIRDEMTSGFNYEWWSGFSLNAEGLEKTIRPALSGGFAALFDNFELLFTGKFTSFGLMIFLFGLTYIFLNAFFNGGVIGLYADEKRTFSISRFFSLSGFYFHHFFALALTAVLLFFVFYKVIHPAIFGLIDHFSVKWMSEKAVWFLNLAGYFIIGLFILFIKIVFDYARIILVVENKESSWLCIWLAFKFMIRHILKTFGLYLILILAGLGLLLVIGFIQELFQPKTLLLLLLLMIFQQVFIILKIGLRFTFYGSQLELYRQYKPEMITVKKRRKVK
ncbi:hypothetical protein JXQ31_06190 [candidate division KSB1 bacterium]|nr:hypothetical protein [candidate division KSB1 bacterium]